MIASRNTNDTTVIFQYFIWASDRSSEAATLVLFILQGMLVYYPDSRADFFWGDAGEDLTLKLDFSGFLSAFLLLFLPEKIIESGLISTHEDDL